MVAVVTTLIAGAAVTGGGTSTLCFQDPVDEADMQAQVDNVREFWELLATILDEDVDFTVDGTVPRYAAESGALQEVFSVDGGDTITGENVGNAVPRSSQGLIRWTTAEVVNGRLLRGRTFVPGMPGASLTDAGGLSSAYSVTLQEAADGLIASTGAELGVWHRPVNGAGGSLEIVTGASVWNQFAVLRSRRD